MHRILSNGRLLWAAAFSLLPLGASAQRVINFDDLSLSPESYDNGSDEAGGFSSGDLFFNNYYDSGYWAEWAFSNVTDNSTTTWENQYSAITGGGVGSTGIYGVGYVDTFLSAIPQIALPEGESIFGIQVTNTTYAYHSLLNGDGFAKKFGGATGDEADFFRLTITGLTASEASTGSVEFYLADYRFEENSLDYIVDEWSWVDLSALGEETRMLEFTLDSSDAGILGMNTPAYFALGEVAVIPEPATFAFWGGLAAGMLVLGRRFKRTKMDA